MGYVGNAPRRETKGWDNNSEEEEEEAGSSNRTGGDDEVPGSDSEDDSQGMSNHSSFRLVGNLHPITAYLYQAYCLPQVVECFISFLSWMYRHIHLGAVLTLNDWYHLGWGCVWWNLILRVNELEPFELCEGWWKRHCWGAGAQVLGPLWGHSACHCTQSAAR